MDTSDSDESIICYYHINSLTNNESDSDNDNMELEYASFGWSETWSSVAVHNFTTFFPQFSNTHVNGYAYIISLDEKLLNKASIQKLRSSL